MPGPAEPLRATPSLAETRRAWPGLAAPYQTTSRLAVPFPAWTRNAVHRLAELKHGLLIALTPHRTLDAMPVCPTMRPLGQRDTVAAATSSLHDPTSRPLVNTVRSDIKLVSAQLAHLEEACGNNLL